MILQYWYSLVNSKSGSIDRYGAWTFTLQIYHMLAWKLVWFSSTNHRIRPQGTASELDTVSDIQCERLIAKHGWMG